MFNIDIAGDKFYKNSGRTCHSFTRSDSLCLSSTTREQFNSITSYIDGSGIYGSDEDTAKKLRTGKDGQLVINNKVRNPSLPTRQQCRFAATPPEKSSDLVAGDERAIVQPALAAMHTVFLKEHNRIATEIKKQLGSFLKVNSNDEVDGIIYQETRRIVIGELQNIIYNEYLPLVLGKSSMESLEINLKKPTSYDPTVDSSIMNDFASAAYRFGHFIVSGLFKPIGHKQWPLKFLYFDFKEFVLGQQGKAFENELRGLASQPCQKADLTTTDDLTDFLFFDKSSKSKVGDEWRGIFREGVTMAYPHTTQ
jgi:peroxidase